MTRPTSVQTTSDERVMAIVAHLFGFLGALIVWALQKDKSGFVRFQATQALAFSVLNSLGMMLLMAGGFLVGFATAAVLAFGPSSSENVPTALMIAVATPFLWTACLMPYSLVVFAVQMYAAFWVGNGRDFRYPWLGARVEDFLNSPQRT